MNSDWLISFSSKFQYLFNTHHPPRTHTQSIHEQQKRQSFNHLMEASSFAKSKLEVMFTVAWSKADSNAKSNRKKKKKISQRHFVHTIGMSLPPPHLLHCAMMAQKTNYHWATEANLMKLWPRNSLLAENLSSLESLRIRHKSIMQSYSIWKRMRSNTPHFLCLFVCWVY